MIEEDEEPEEAAPSQSIDEVLQSPPPDEVPAEKPEPAPSEISHSRTASMSRTKANADSRAADRKELEQMRAKLRTLEKKIADDSGKLQRFDALQTDKDRYETIIQTLQKKLKTNQQTMTELRTFKEEAEQRTEEVPLPNGELESELELAKLDRELAEERAEIARTELAELKSKHEDAELDLEILREENRELSATMSPEELSSAGWLQKEREIERLKHAVLALRDHSRDMEQDLSAQIKELRESLEETEKTSSLYQESASQLTQLQSTNKHLMEQLEDAETNDEVVVAMEAQREQSATMIEQLKRQIQEFEEHIQVTDELEKFHVEEERQLHTDLDDAEAQLSERFRHAGEQEKVIEELEFTLSKFREVVSGLQSDIDELRQCRDLNETEAQEMTVKSRAMMDLNLQLQNTAAKTQLKTIDYEMRDMQADQAKSQLEIVQLFVPESFAQDRNPVLAMLAFKRIKSKSLLVRTLLTERMRDRPHLAQDDPFTVFEVMEKMDRISSSCERFLHFVHNCSPEHFQQFSGALYELEPVERTVSGWVEALRRDELSTEGPEVIQRVIEILLDMAEKLIAESDESKATELIEQSSTIVAYTDITALELAALARLVQKRLGDPNEDDEEAISFHKKFDAMAMKARTTKYLSGKVTQALTELRATSMCLGETSWVFFEDAMQSAEQFSVLIRTIGRAIASELAKFDHDEPLTYVSIANLMLQFAQTDSSSSVDSIYTLFSTNLAQLATKVDDLSSRSADLPSAAEFEPISLTPWLVRARFLRQQKALSQDTAEELARLKQRSETQVRDLAEKNKESEELRIRVEVLESRQREAKSKDSEVATLRSEVERVRAEKESLETEAESTKAALQIAEQRHAKEKEELDALKTAALAEGGTAAAAAAAAQLTDLDGGAGGGAWRVEAEMLRAEVLSLQAAVRYLRQENHSLRVPVGEVALRSERNRWLLGHPRDLLNPRGVTTEKKTQQPTPQREVKDVMQELIDLASQMKGVHLKLRSARSDTAASVEDAESEGADLAGRNARSTLRRNNYSNQLLVAQQREMLERWMADVQDVRKRARLASSGTSARKGAAGATGQRYALPPLPVAKDASGSVETGKVRVVGVDA